MTAAVQIFTTPDADCEISALLDCLARLDGKARVIVDRCGMVLASSANALGVAPGDMVRADQPLCSHSADPAAAGTLGQLLAIQDEETGIALIEQACGDDPLLVRTTALDEGRVCLLIAGPVHDSCERITELQILFGLTECEAHVAADLMRGFTPAAIAQRRKNSIHTIRAHIRQCHRKLGAKNKEEMFNRMINFFG
jgi:DNA-binding CsgD family transcriptional regulator